MRSGHWDIGLTGKEFYLVKNSIHTQAPKSAAEVTAKMILIHVARD